MRQLEIKLYGAALPFPPYGILYLQIYLGSVKRAVSRIWEAAVSLSRGPEVAFSVHKGQFLALDSCDTDEAVFA